VASLCEATRRHADLGPANRRPVGRRSLWWMVDVSVDIVRLGHSQPESPVVKPRLAPHRPWYGPFSRQWKPRPKPSPCWRPSSLGCKVPSSAAMRGGEPAHWRISVAWLGLDPPKRSPAKLALRPHNRTHCAGTAFRSNSLPRWVALYTDFA
jgi:hypothetical protein